MKSIRLNPVGPFAEIPRSDTLFGAICWGIRLSRGEAELEAILAEFAEGNPPFLISSAFPTLDGDPSVRFYPRPRLPSPDVDVGDVTDDRVEALKTWKKIAYLPEAIFEGLARGDLTKADVLAALSEDETLLDGTEYERFEEFLLPEAALSDDSEEGDGNEGDGRQDSDTANAGDTQEDNKPIQRSERIRNAVNRLTNSTDGQLYQQRAVHFAPDAGLHVLASDDGNIDAVIEGLSLIQDRGIGGGRSVGQGQYELGSIDEVDIPAPDGDRFCTLSLCIPRDSELEALASDGYYGIETRKGVLEDEATASPAVWKRRVLAVEEGSILPRTTPPHGHNPIVADEFSDGVQQYGYALPVAMRALEGAT